MFCSFSEVRGPSVPIKSVRIKVLASALDSVGKSAGGCRFKGKTKKR